MGDSAQEIERFTSLAAHELGSPLRLLRAFSSHLRDDLPSPLPPDAEEDLAAIEVSVDRMSALVEGLLWFSRAAQPRLKVQSVEPGELVAQAREQLADLIAQRGATVEAASLPRLRSDPAWLGRVLVHLIKNGVEHSSGTNRVIRVFWSASRSALVVSNDGPGLPDSLHERVFEPFPRIRGVHETTGVGLGLATSRRVMVAMGGDLQVCLDELNQTHFYACFPESARLDPPWEA